MGWAFVLTQKGLPRKHSGKEIACQCRRCKRCRFDALAWEDLLEEEMATHSSILAYEIPWTEEPVGPQSMRSQKIQEQLSA